MYILWVNCPKSLKIHKEKCWELEQTKGSIKVEGKKEAYKGYESFLLLLAEGTKWNTISIAEKMQTWINGD